MRFLAAARQIDWIMLMAASLLILIGLAMLFSATYLATPLSGLFIRQAVAAAIGLMFFFFISAVPYHVIARYTIPIYILGIAGLVLVALTGSVIRGSISRFALFGVQLQPSEFMKIALILGLSAGLARFTLIRWRALLVSALIVGLPTALVLLEPDVGVAALLLAVWGVVLVFRGLPWRAIIVLLLLAILLFGVSWQWLFLDYQKARLLNFLHPTLDPRGSGYNVVQSIVALGSGEISGRGLGHGPQSQLKFLPERHTDFILASIGEELGFIGVLLVIVLYGELLWRILRIATSTRDPFGQLVVVGVFVLLLISFLVSAGMNMGLLPVTGIPLPLVSYGGSNLVSTLILLGLVQSVRVYSKWTQAPPMEIDQL